MSSCSEDDTIGDLKKMVAAQTGTRPDKIRIQKWWVPRTSLFACCMCPASAIFWQPLQLFHRYTVYKDHITLDDYEVSRAMNGWQT